MAAVNFDPFPERDLHRRGVNVSKSGARPMVFANTRSWHRFLPGLMVLCMVPWIAATGIDRAEEPWPLLLNAAQTDADPNIAMLQLRANASLERLMESGGVTQDSWPALTVHQR
jgi:hypothetical protein